MSKFRVLNRLLPAELIFEIVFNIPTLSLFGRNGPPCITGIVSRQFETFRDLKKENYRKLNYLIDIISIKCKTQITYRGHINRRFYVHEHSVKRDLVNIKYNKLHYYVRYGRSEKNLLEGVTWFSPYDETSSFLALLFKRTLYGFIQSANPFTMRKYIVLGPIMFNELPLIFHKSVDKMIKFGIYPGNYAIMDIFDRILYDTEHYFRLFLKNDGNINVTDYERSLANAYDYMR